MVIDSKKYMIELWNSIQSRTSTPQWIRQEITDVAALSKSYDTVILTCGASIANLWSTDTTSSNNNNNNNSNNINSNVLLENIKLVRGQSLHFQTNTKENDTIIEDSGQNNIHPILCGEYIVPQLDGTLICGATHEYSDAWDILNAPPDMSTACDLLNDKISYLYPPMNTVALVGCSAGTRVNSKRTHLGKIPMIGRHPEYSNVWVLTGLGSRGLLYHAYLGEVLVSAIIANDDSILPQEVRLRA